MSRNKSYGTISGNPKIVFECHVCGFTGKTSGFPLSCPKCHYSPLKEIQNQREDPQEILAAKMEEEV
jgi:rubrerythrin